MGILLIGGTGFIGSYVLRQLVTEGQKNLVVFDLYPDLSRIQDVAETVKVIRGDITDLPQLLEVIKENTIDRLFHFAYLLRDSCQTNPRKAIDINLVGFNNVFEAARIMDINRIVWPSSIGVYGPADYYTQFYGETPLTEDAPKNPLSIYGECKLFNETMARYYFETYGLDNVALRPHTVYGLGKASGLPLWATTLFEHPALGKSLQVNGELKANLIYVKDVANAFVLALKADPLTHRVFNICGYDTCLKDAALIVKKLIPTANIQFIEGPPSIFPTSFDTSRAQRELKWTLSYTLEEAIKEYINMVRQRAGLPVL